MHEIDLEHLRACPTCGLTQLVPETDDPPPHMRVCCARCGTALRTHRDFARHATLTAALALAALLLYPVAVTMPILKVQQMGNASATSIIDGVITLLADGDILVGLIVLFCSVILPLGKLLALLTMSLLGDRLAHGHRALTYRIIDFTGRWGMLDVLAVAVLVAALKLGNVMDVAPGPAAFTFCLCVLLSLLATASFDPHSVWEKEMATENGSTANPREAAA